ncbi:hypothetical protein WN48_10495 [Eufriesea mexicana]|nr:hypothetical protein WN48_10495 [Eufriesea mexicana]
MMPSDRTGKARLLILRDAESRSLTSTQTLSSTHPVINNSIWASSEPPSGDQAVPASRSELGGMSSGDQVRGDEHRGGSLPEVPVAHRSAVVRRVQGPEDHRPRSESFGVILAIRRGGRADAGYVDATPTRTARAGGGAPDEDGGTARSRANAGRPDVSTPSVQPPKTPPRGCDVGARGGQPLYSAMPTSAPGPGWPAQDRTITPTGSSFPRGQLDCRPYPRRARFSLAGQKEERRLGRRESGVFRLGSVGVPRPTGRNGHQRDRVCDATTVHGDDRTEDQVIRPTSTVSLRKRQPELDTGDSVLATSRVEISDSRIDDLDVRKFSKSSGSFDAMESFSVLATSRVEISDPG